MNRLCRFPWLLLSALAAVGTVRSEDVVSLGAYARSARETLEQRIRQALRKETAEGEVTGTVTFAGDDHFFIQMAQDGLKVFSDARPRVGDVVQILGTPSLEGGHVVFVASRWERIGEAALPEPLDADHASLFSSQSAANWLRVRVTGRAVGCKDGGFAIETEKLPVNIWAPDIPAFIEDCATTHPLVTVTGVAEIVLDQSSLFRAEREILGVRISVNSTEDIVLRPDPVYLINRRDRRAIWLVGLLVTGLSLGLAALLVVFVRQRRRHFKTVTLMAERKRMADDIHDTIEQHLVGAGMLIQLNRLKEANDVLVRAKREIRDIVWGLKNDDMMRLSPAEMLQAMAKDETRKGLYRVTAAHLAELPAHLGAAAMRDLSLVVREATGNAVKHGGAKKIAISADALGGGGWMLRIANDGRPFDSKAAPGPAEGHFGLEGMRERARRIGGEISFGTKGDWTVVTLLCRETGE